MLSQQTIAVIKSTVPVLQSHGKAITTRFYERMFANHPELLHIFNHANQKQGRQQTALANAVYAAAAHIDNLEAILPAVKLIGHKHRSLGIKPEHYPIVGQNLLAAIKDVLGEAATDDIINAWAEAYQVIADVFISVEEQMYRDAEELPGGWRDFRNFVVVQKVKESDVITSFYLKPQDGQALSPFQPGQYISVKLQIPGETYTHIRQYSLSDSPGKDYYRISVKREDARDNKPAGVVSHYLHDHVNEGDVLPVSAPAGDFVLDMTKETPVVLLSGGVGLTPMISMLNAMVEKQPGRPVTFIHAALNSKTHAMKEHVKSLAATYDQVKSYVLYSEPTDEDKANRQYDKEGYIDLTWLQSVADKQADFYFCGPVPFMKSVHRALKEWGVPQERIHYEFFGPLASLEE
ncbi:NO-inducible flavohemoprotein [Brevibacillus sp. H7]|uniref:NO-inducible flavohemoprotein n=1 Tax=Brevibacillus sp. H7 TaxID=3349138 RepID=UPI00381D9637